jgi:hypothetical protein
MAFEAELTLEGVVDRLDQLADLLEHRLAIAGLLVCAGGPQQCDRVTGQQLLEVPPGEALIGDQQDAVMPGGHVCFHLQHRGQRFPLAELRIRKRPHDRHPHRSAHQIQPQSPKNRECEAQ